MNILTKQQIDEMPRLESFNDEQMDCFRSKANQLLDEGTGEATPTILYAMSFTQVLFGFRKFVAGGLYDHYKNDRNKMPAELRRCSETTLLSIGKLLGVINTYGRIIGIGRVTTEDLVRQIKKEEDEKR